MGSPQYPRNSLADLLHSDRPRTSKVHVAAFEEQDCPNAIDIHCACGWYGHTLWGVEQAKVMFSRHKMQNGASPVVIPLL